jgi:hypothetical protein
VISVQIKPWERGVARGPGREALTAAWARHGLEVGEPRHAGRPAAEPLNTWRLPVLYPFGTTVSAPSWN